MMKIEMRVTWMRVGDPNPQTAGWFDPQADNLTIDLPLGGALLRFCSASNAPRTVSPPSRRSHILSSQPPPPVRSISTRTPSAPNTAPDPDLDLHTVHERPPTSPSSLFLPLQSPTQKPGAPQRGAWPPAAPAHLRADTVSGSGQTSCRPAPIAPSTPPTDSSSALLAPLPRRNPDSTLVAGPLSLRPIPESHRIPATGAV